MEEQSSADFTHSESFRREWSKIVAKAWADPEFRAKLEADPKLVLRERGIEVPDEVYLKTTDDTVNSLGVIRPMEMAVAAGTACVGACSSPQPGGMDPSQMGRWGACITT